ncbi:hypothetical protein Tco_1201814 [Tanacetum coccineum]
MSLTSFKQMRSHAGNAKDSRRIRSGSGTDYWRLDRLACHKKQRSTQYLQQRPKTLPFLKMLCSNPMDVIQLKDYGFEFNKIPLYCDNKSAICSLRTMSKHSRFQSTSTTSPFHSESKWTNRSGLNSNYYRGNELSTCEHTHKSITKRMVRISSSTPRHEEFDP